MASDIQSVTTDGKKPAATTSWDTLISSKERRKEMFYLTTHSANFIYGYMVSDMVKDHSDSERKPAATT